MKGITMTLKEFNDGLKVLNKDVDNSFGENKDFKQEVYLYWHKFGLHVDVMYMNKRGDQHFRGAVDNAKRNLKEMNRY